MNFYSEYESEDKDNIAFVNYELGCLFFDKNEYKKSAEYKKYNQKIIQEYRKYINTISNQQQKSSIAVALKSIEENLTKQQDKLQQRNDEQMNELWKYVKYIIKMQKNLQETIQTQKNLIFNKKIYGKKTKLKLKIYIKYKMI